MSDDNTSRLREALGVTKPIRLAVTRDSQKRPEYVDVERPFAIIGRGNGCDVVLNQRRVSFRHAYLQAFGDRVLCVDLLSNSGMTWDGSEDHNQWLTPAHRIGIVNNTLQLLDEGWDTAGPSWPSPLESKTRDHQIEAFGPLPDVHLELANRRLKGMSWPINRVMTLLGRDERCRVTCGDERISRVHCSLVLTPAGLWVIDLLGRGGITVNGESLPFALLGDGDELGVGQYRMRAVYESPVAPQAEANLADDVSQENTPDSQATVPPETAEFNTAQVAAAIRAARNDGMPDPEFMTRNNKVFPVIFDGDTIIVSPQGGIRTAAYQEMQLESNAVTQILATRDYLPNLVVDINQTDAMDSIVINCVAVMCRAAKNKAAMCNVSEAMLEVLGDMSLTKVWPHFSTREEALNYVRS